MMEMSDNIAYCLEPSTFYTADMSVRGCNATSDIGGLCGKVVLLHKGTTTTARAEVITSILPTDNPI